MTKVWTRLSSPQNPGTNPMMLWIRDHLNYQSDDCLTWPFNRRNAGYGAIGVAKNKCMDAHRYICIQVHGEPPTPNHQAAHSCERGHEGCVNPRHLSWKTMSENLKDGWKYGNRKGRRFLLTPEIVAEIKVELSNGGKPTDLAKRHGVSEWNIRAIRSGKIWGGNTMKFRLFTDDEVRAIRNARGRPHDIAKQYGAGMNAIYRIRNRETYKHVSD